ncbi:MAG: AAA family ATPase [Sandaracinaceae bacterium]
MPALCSIHARSLQHVDAVDIKLPEPERGRRHFALIGPSGSGKSTLLEALAREVETVVRGTAHPARLLDLRPAAEDDERERRMAHLNRPVRVTWSREERSLPDDFAAGLLVLVSRPVREVLPYDPLPTTPTPMDTDPSSATEALAPRLLAVLAARQAEAQEAHQRGDEIAAGVHDAWLLRVQSDLRHVLGVPALHLTFVQGAPTLVFPTGERLPFDALSRGPAMAVQLWAEIFLRIEAARERAQLPTLEASALAIVDTPELGLDPRLQRTLLPALASLFPKVQLVVSTHSPLLVESLDQSVVYDLGRKRARAIEEVREAGIEALIADMVNVEAPRPPLLRPRRAERPKPPSFPRPIPSLSDPPDPVRGTRDGHAAWTEDEP